MQKNCMHYLQKLGTYVIDLFSSGEQFLFAWDEQPYDLVLLDIQMKGMNGLETARKLREKDTHVHLVFLTNDPPLYLTAMRWMLSVTG